MTEPFDYSKLKPLNDCVIAKPYEKKEEIGGIIIPGSAQEQKTRSVVVAVGPGVRNDDGSRDTLRVKPGDHIFHSQFAGSETKIEQGKYLVMRDQINGTDIFGIFTGEQPIDIDPFDDRLLLEWEEGLMEYKNTNILRARTGMDRHYTGIVLAKGPMVYDVEVGQRVFFDQFCGPERINFNGKRYAFIHEANIYMIIPERQEMEILSQ